MLRAYWVGSVKLHVLECIHVVRCCEALDNMCKIQMLYVVSYMCTIVGVYSCAVGAELGRFVGAAVQVRAHVTRNKAKATMVVDNIGGRVGTIVRMPSLAWRLVDGVVVQIDCLKGRIGLGGV